MATRRPVLHPVHHLSGQLSSLTNFAEFLAFRALPSPVPRRAIASDLYLGPGPESLGPEFFGGSKQDAWIGIWIVIRAECGHCGHILVLQ
jgi:hypothetical protein